MHTSQGQSSRHVVEANGMSEGLAETEWGATWFGLAKDLNYDMRERHKLNREIKVTTVMREPESELESETVSESGTSRSKEASVS